jgi:hypothetical protein
MLKVWSIGVRTTKSRKKLQENPGEKNGSGDKFSAESKVHCFGRNKTVSPVSCLGKGTDLFKGKVKVIALLVK